MNGSESTGACARSVSTGRRVAYPETLSVALSTGWLDRIDTAADALGMSRADYVRRALRRALDASRKAAARTGGA